MVNFWKMTYEKVKEQRDQYKVERDTLINDIADLRANNKRLERENRELFSRDVELHENINSKLKTIGDLAQENKALRLQANTYFDEWQTVKNLYNTLTQHIRQKAKVNPNVHRYIALVNCIDRLEKGEN